MAYHRIVYNGYLVAAGEIGNGEPITKNEYQQIVEAFANRPPAPDPFGYTYKLRADNLEWELVELPPAPEYEPTIEDKAEAYDILMGVSE